MENAQPLSNKPEGSQSPNWKCLVAEWKSSGLTRRKFCQQKQLDYHQFLYQRTKYGEKSQSLLPSWLSVEAGKKKSLPISSGIGQALPGYFILKMPEGGQLSIPAQADINTLKVLLNFIRETRC